MRSRLARFVLRATRWTAVGEVPRTGVLVGAPHTSNWDFVMMLLIMWRGGVTPRVLIKKELFRGPLGWLLPRLGGIPLDRDNPGAVVRELVREAQQRRAVPAHPRRRGHPHQGRVLEVRLLAASRARPSCRSPWPSSTAPRAQRDSARPSPPRSDVVADMDQVRDFYADKRGIHPERRTEPRLREELTARAATRSEPDGRPPGHPSSRCATCSLVKRWPGSSRSRTARKSSNRG